MLWDSVTDNACEVCECSSMIKTSFNLSEQCCNNFRHEESCLEKENAQQRLGNSPLKHESDLSLYSNSSPQRRPCHASSPSHCNHPRRPLEDLDGNSQDSGYGASCCPVEGEKFFRIAKSLGVTPRQEPSPPKSCRMSFSSMDSMDDEFLEFTDLEQPMDENSRLPTDFNTLINGSFSSASTNNKELSPEYLLPARPPLRRSMSLNVEGHTPNRRVRSCLFKPEEIEFRPFKRPEPPTEAKSPIQNKRSRIVLDDDDEADDELPLAAVPRSTRPVLQRSVSASEESIKYALHRSSTEPDLIGDFSKAFSLPLTTGRHQDLKSITAATLNLLMKGEFSDMVSSYKVIDCRYPYEFDGGHISGASNLYTKDQILEELLDVNSAPPATLETRRRHILVFHCEFSSERGPNLYRFLRNLDRIRNKDVYPALHYPEIYLLEGGYKNFYEQYTELCVPESYKPMLHPEHQNDLRHFRAKSKTWNADRLRPNNRGSLKRLGFL